MALIEVKNLRKDYITIKRSSRLRDTFKDLFRKDTSSFTAVDDISFNIEKGECVGYIGPNGAGKTTSIRILSGIIVPTSGVVKVKNMIPWRDRVKYVKSVGMIFGNRLQLWPELTPSQSFDLLKSIYEVDDKEFKNNLEYISHILEIEPLLHRPLREFSLGQRMRCELASTFLHSPDIVFLDEPTIGLDIDVKKKIREFIKQINKEKETTIIYTSHDLKEIEEVCNRLMVINKGKIIYDGKTEEIKNKYSSFRKIKIKIPDLEEKNNFVASIGNIVEAERHMKCMVKGNIIEILFRSDLFHFSKFISYMNEYKKIGDIVIEDSDIENIVLDMYKEV